MQHARRYTVVGLFALGLMAGASAAYAAVSADAPPAEVSATVADADIHPGIMAHRAVYRMDLVSARNNSDVRGASGVMSFEWKDACNGWATEQRLDVDFTHGDQNGVNLTSTFIAWESKDGTKYRFNYRRLGNGQVIEAYRGSATLSAPGGNGIATYTMPEKREVALPAGSYFPTAHTLAMLDAAVARKPIFTASVFDGTDTSGYSEINAVIGHRRPVDVAIARTGSEDGPNVAWPVRMAFFSADGQQAEPDFEMDTTVLPNGVSEFMVIDYGDFKLRGTLEKLELLPKPEC